MYNIRCDLHTHTICSVGGTSTVEDNIEAAKVKGLELIAVTDHFSSLAVNADKELGAEEVLGDTTAWQEDSIIILRGAEVDIASPEGYLFGIGLPEKPMKTGDICKPPYSGVGNTPETGDFGDPFAGQEDLFQRAGGMLDFIIASVSKKLIVFDMTKTQATDAIIKAIGDPRVLMPGHLGRFNLPIDFREIVKTAKALNKPIEINELDYKAGGDTAGRYMEIALICAEEGCHICVNSDAYSAGDIGSFNNVEAILRAIQFPEELIINRDSTGFMEYYQRAGFR